MRTHVLLASAVAAAVSITVHAQAPAPAHLMPLWRQPSAPLHGLPGDLRPHLRAPENAAAPARPGCRARSGSARPRRARSRDLVRAAYKVFDISTSSDEDPFGVALTTSDGIIVIDTLFDYRSSGMFEG